MEKQIQLRNQKGFTLIEIAIVLVIVGLLIGGILKGQSMIHNAKVKRLVNDFEGLKTAVLAYQDRFGMYPGDENDPNSPSATDDGYEGNNNGLFDGAERGPVMEDLRLAGLLSGSGTDLPSHGYGGNIRLQRANIGNSGAINQIIASNVPGDICQEIDSKYDDGIQTSGDIRGSAAYTGANVGSFAWKF
jgi:prepilin-type N-terminal cleavage/methylation domain-containing protein